MFKIIKKVTKQGVRRFVEIPKDYYDVVQAGDKVTIILPSKTQNWRNQTVPQK